MTWFGWLIVGLIAYSNLVTISKVGKPRKPTDGREAVFVTIINALFIIGILVVGTGSL